MDKEYAALTSGQIIKNLPDQPVIFDWYVIKWHLVLNWFFIPALPVSQFV
ncbi:hypothetical protein [Candidatus Methylobacter favarea]|nr:hypothetical protein [Candidatus Methylobacter favarea]